MHIQIIVGSIRQGRRAKPIGDWAYQLAAQREDLSVELIDLRDWNLPMFDFSKPPIMGDYENPLQQRRANKIAQGDGYLFIQPGVQSRLYSTPEERGAPIAFKTERAVTMNRFLEVANAS